MPGMMSGINLIICHDGGVKGHKTIRCLGGGAVGQDRPFAYSGLDCSA
jgi:hypothetical protein